VTRPNTTVHVVLGVRAVAAVNRGTLVICAP
jgi:hypothetical protein